MVDTSHEEIAVRGARLGSLLEVRATPLLALAEQLPGVSSVESLLVGDVCIVKVIVLLVRIEVKTSLQIFGVQKLFNVFDVLVVFEDRQTLLSAFVGHQRLARVLILSVALERLDQAFA